jgi:hypothetical protein
MDSSVPPVLDETAFVPLREPDVVLRLLAAFLDEVFLFFGFHRQRAVF